MKVKKKKILSFLLSLAVVFSFMPFTAIQADAFSTGSKTLIKEKTVTIKPGKTYKSPAFKINKKMLFQVPVNVSVSPKSKAETVTKGGYTMTFKKGKKAAAKFSDELLELGNGDEFPYDNWIYFYNSKKVKTALFEKGNYNLYIKNNTNCTLKVKFSVKGYTKYASKAELKKSLTVDFDNLKNTKIYYPYHAMPYVYIGRIGPGVPVIESVKCSNKNWEPDVYVDPDGKVYACVENSKNNASTVFSIKLKNSKKPYKVKVKVLNYN